MRASIAPRPTSVWAISSTRLNGSIGPPKSVAACRRHTVRGANAGLEPPRSDCGLAAASGRTASAAREQAVRGDDRRERA
jgi:hypothetical protein